MFCELISLAKNPSLGSVCIEVRAITPPNAQTDHLKAEVYQFMKRIKTNGKTRVEYQKSEMITFPCRFMIYVKIWLKVTASDSKGHTKVDISLNSDLSDRDQLEIQQIQENFQRFNHFTLMEVKDYLSPVRLQEFATLVVQYRELKGLLADCKTETWGTHSVFSRHTFEKTPEKDVLSLFLRYKFFTNDLNTLSFQFAGVPIV